MTKTKTLGSTFRFTVAKWTKYGDLKTVKVKVVAKDEDSAWEKIEKRYKGIAYDITID